VKNKSLAHFELSELERSPLPSRWNAGFEFKAWAFPRTNQTLDMIRDKTTNNVEWLMIKDINDFSESGVYWEFDIHGGDRAWNRKETAVRGSSAKSRGK
jgi:hypothetical protein